MTSADLSMFDSGNVQVIEWDMLDKAKFLPLSVASVLAVRGVVYPLTVVKTRIQVQHGSDHYKGTFRTFGAIYANEGWRGLYRGFLINGCQVFSSLFYLTAYEKTREILLKEFSLQNNTLRGLIGGGCASAFSQLILVPFDVISQHMMVLERQKKLCVNSTIDSTSKPSTSKQAPYSTSVRRVASNATRTVDTLNLAAHLDKNPHLKIAPLVCREIYRRDGMIRGFYRGYVASLLIFAPSSAMFWGFYHFYYETLRSISPVSSPHLLLQGFAAPISGATLAILTNPLDLFRSNLQVHGQGWRVTVKRLCAEDGWTVLHKGLSTRLITIPFSSLLLIVGYEFIKRLSVHEHLQHTIRW